MSDGDALLWSVLAAPADDAPRLVYADWLDEHGQSERADFIRVQVELWQARDGAVSSQATALRARAEELLRRRVLGPGRRRMPAREVWAAPAGSGQAVRFTRGFVASVGCSARWLVDHARPLFRTHPVEVVALTDKEPYRNAGMGDPDHPWVWLYNDPQRAVMSPTCIPDPLFGLLGGLRVGRGLFANQVYSTETAAYADLMSAALAYGRNVAGLPAPSRTPPLVAAEPQSAPDAGRDNG